MSESIGSDSEFDRYMQDSFSSSIASSLSLSISDNQFKNSNDASMPPLTGGVSTLGMSWLKSPTVASQGASSVTMGTTRHSLDVVKVPSLANENDEFLPQGLYDDTSDEQDDDGGTKVNMSGRRPHSSQHRNSVTDDLLNFSQSSGFSLLSELEHQLGMRPSVKLTSPSRKPGEETLMEDDDKKRFFDELERGKDSPIDYSELNRQLSNTSLSMRGLTSANPLRTIDENDATPHISSDEESTLDSHTHLPTVSGQMNIIDPHSLGHHVGGTSSDSSLQSSSNRSLSLPSPLHSSSAHSMSKVLTKTTPTKSPLRSSNTDKLAPITEKHLEKVSKVGEDDNRQSEGVVTKSLTAENKLGVNMLKSLPMSKSSSNIHSNDKLDTESTHKQHLAPKLNLETKSVPSPQFEPIRSQPGKSTGQVMAAKPEALLLPVTTPNMVIGERNLDQLLRELATEELATLTHKIVSEEKGVEEMTKMEEDRGREMDSESDRVSSTEREIDQSDTNSIEQDSLERSVSQTGKDDVHVANTRTTDRQSSQVNSHTAKPSLVSNNFPSLVSDNFPALHEHVHGRHDNLLTRGDTLELVTAELKNEREHVVDLEDRMREKEREQEKIKLEYSQQIRELRTQLLDNRSKLRKLEDKDKHHQLTTPTPGTPNKEQERLIQGYQKENEKLYSELTQLRKQFQSIKTELTDENNILGVELANLRVKAATQEEALSQLREQQSRYRPPNTGYHMAQENTDTVQLYKEKCNSLEGQVEVLTIEKKKLSNEIETKNMEIMKVQLEKERIEKQTNEKVSMLRNEVQQVYLNSEKKLQQKEEELVSLRYIIKNTPDVPVTTKPVTKTSLLPSNKAEGGPYLVRSRTAADAKRIKDLERQVQELYTSLKKRHPNSIPVLMYATNANGGRSDDDRDMVRQLEKKVKELERQLMEREMGGRKKMDELQERFHEMEVLYEEQIGSLSAQLTEANSTRERGPSIERKSRDRKTVGNNENKHENSKLKEKVSQLSLELAHQKVQLKGYIAEIENERRKTQEQWEDKMIHIEQDHKQKLDQLMISLINDRDDSDVVRLRSRLAAREAKIRTLEEEIDLVKTDGEILSVLKSREQELEKQVDLQKEELLEAKRYQTPEMHHYSSLLAKISHLETRQCEYQRKIEDMSSGHVTQEELRKTERKYKKKLTEKNLQIEKFREELDVLMDTLYSIQKGNLFIKQ